MNPSLSGYAAAVLGAVPERDRARVADELRAVEDLLVGTAELFTALTDTAVPAAARRGVLDDLLRGKVGEPARRVAVHAAGAVRAPDLPAALAWLSQRAQHLADGDVRPEPHLGLTASRERVAGFAAAVYEDTPTAELDDVEDELFRFARMVEASPELRAALSDRDLPVSSRQAVVDELLASRVHAATLGLVRYAIAGGRSRDVVGTLDFLVEETARARGWRVARVRAGQPVDEDERTRLSESLTRLAGSPVELQVTVDPHLLSGVLVRVGDLQVDATARGRLDALREHLHNATWDTPTYGTDDEQGAG